MPPSRKARAQLHPPIHLAGVTYQQRWVQCGQRRRGRRCKRWHGPYWYAFYKSPATTEPESGERVSGRTRQVYIGLELPAAVIEEVRARAGSEAEVELEVRREVRARKKASQR